MRLALAYGTPRGCVDGAWWPRSCDPAVEITLLAAAVSAAYSGRVLNLVYDRTRWLPVPRSTPSGRGWHNRLPYDRSSRDRLRRGQSRYTSGRLRSGQPLTDPDLITLVMLNGVQVVLLILPPGLADEQASWAARRACQPLNTLSPLEILREARLAAAASSPTSAVRSCAPATI